MKIDLSKDTFEAFLRPWEVPLFKHVLSTDDQITSSQAHKWVLAQPDKGLHRSRTSVIFFLQDLVEDGFLTRTEEMGKGGAREIYQRVADLNWALNELSRRCTILFSNLRNGV